MALPAYAAAHAEDFTRYDYWLLEILTPAPLRWTNYRLALSALSFTWAPKNFVLPELDDEIDQELTITVDDADDVLAALYLGGNLESKELRVYQVWLDPTDRVTVAATYRRFIGVLDRPEFSDVECSLVVRNAQDLSGHRFPDWNVGPTCPYDYAERLTNECGYAGGLSTCRRDFDDCTAHANTARFGGHRSIPGPTTTVVWGAGGFRLS